MSSDYADHPVSFLTVGLFEEHDRSRFDITAVSLSPDPPAPSRPQSGLIEIELGNGSQVRVGSDVNLAALRRVLTALRG